MAVRRKAFSTYKPGNADNGPVEVVLNEGVVVNGKSIEGVFRFQPEIAGITLLDFVAEISDDDPGVQARTVRRLFEQTVLPESKEALFEYISNPMHGLDPEKLTEVAGYLMEVYSANPTESPSKSSDGLPTNGAGSSEERSFVTESTYEDSRQTF